MVMESEVRIQLRNKVSLAALVLTKVCGFIGVALGFAGHVNMGFGFLVLACALLITIIVLCFKNFKEVRKEESLEKSMLRKMIQEGTLNQYIRDIKYNNG